MISPLAVILDVFHLPFLPHTIGITMCVHPVTVSLGKAQASARPSLVAAQQVTRRALTQKNRILKTATQLLHQRKIGRLDYF